jgi:hypothetical protein
MQARGRGPPGDDRRRFDVVREFAKLSDGLRVRKGTIDENGNGV